ncbi:dihydrodipicolinate synthase family protein [Jiangella ureilytica]|uniref:Dihydrodipicolinate synthase family protein n=1 Tax=Jiangella ureilytica TaxID=2530374 RepID=A0A4R4RS90_9ACTN|nr:dihydrodipicolinate synthase family protein [Jiangella ureilytica]TDC52780.1 dihydrodipicolinate synthase family protein [Jiangella ureilytica]
MVQAKYGRHEAKDAAKELLRGVITAPCLPVDANGELDEDGWRHDLRHCLDVIQASGLYVNGYYGHFWLLTSEQRRRVVEIAVEEAGGRVPIIARCAHPSPGEAIALAKHAQGLGVDFISLVLPQFGGAHKDALFGYFETIAREIELGITIFNTRQAGYAIAPETMAELAEIPNICALKNGLDMAHTIRIRELVGDSIVVVDPNEENFLVNLTQFGQQAIYTGTNMMFDSATRQPMRDYVQAGLAGRFEEAARGFYELQRLRDLHSAWVLTPWRAKGLCPIATVKLWSHLQGMTGGPVPPAIPALSKTEEDQLRDELAAAGVGA